MRRIELLALDIDGTILTVNKKLTLRTEAAIRSAIGQGISVVLVTGRPFCGIPTELLSIPGIDYVITSNGAVTTDLHQHKTIRKANIDAETAISILQVPRKYNLIHAVFINGIGYCEKDSFERHLKLIEGKAIVSYIRQSRRIISCLDDLILTATHGVENIWFIVIEPQLRQKLYRMIPEHWNVRAVNTSQTDIEVGNYLADKGYAISELARQIGISRDRILAVGDSGNDIGMLQSAGISVAMGNAEEEIKSIADYITDTNEEDGAAKVIEHVLFGDLDHLKKRK